MQQRKQLSTEEIVRHRQGFIDHVPHDMPEGDKGRMTQAVHRSLDALQAGDGNTALSAIQELLAIVEKHPEAGRGEPGLGHNLWAQYWSGCGNDCGLGGIGGSVTNAGVYAVCYWSCVAAYSF
ncbi:MAG TPA: hypothetical protein VMU89_15805 [Thermomicrobiaceae bacterium]|nr:hypothetical protein [Thermomicrobiaceae bacterium]